jgi:UDP-3-O-[3-hydroxymyristoyl] N-acetylglucosamine deacetylase/3-hydroxyacyl-[acyl-carrier-protein] dehydratase
MSSTRQQRTLARAAVVRGVGYLTGPDVQLRFVPAEPNSGLAFVRTDLPNRPRIPASIAFVADRQRRTTLETSEARVEMVEHVLAALAGLEIDNCTIEIDAVETPGCDGSSGAFVEAIVAAGAVEQPAIRQSFVVDRPYSVRDGDAMLAIHPPSGDGLFVSYSLDYGPHSPIDRQGYFTRLSPVTFQHELATSRTFLLKAEADALRAQGVGARTSARDLLVFGPDGPIENELRFQDEPARHKILDVVGDLALFGRDLVGHVVGYKSGHRLNAELVRELAEAVRENENRSREAVLDISQIAKALPHRYPFLLVDRVIELEPGRRAVGIKNVTINEPFFQGHWPGRPIMPGVMIVEAMAQMAGVLFSQDAFDREYVSMLLSMDGVKLRRAVVPGDQLVLEVETVRAKLRTFHVRTRALVDGSVAAEAELRFIRVQASDSLAA